MAFKLNWTPIAAQTYAELRDKAKTSIENRKTKKIKKSSPVEGLFKQIDKTVNFLGQNPKHPGLNTHPYDSLSHPYNSSEKVFEAYVQNNTPGAYRLFWCYGPEKNEITIIAITPHP